jgi:hypothetical protein
MPSLRTTTHATPGRRPLVVAALLLCVLGLLPLRWTGWIGWFGDLAWRVVAPVSHPISEMARWVSPGGDLVLSDQPEAVLASELELTRQALLRERADNDRLRALIEDLQRGFSVDLSSPVRPLARPVIGNPSDLAGGVLMVRAGRDDGVTTNTVVTFDGMQLVGRVERVLGSVCEVRPITAKRSGRLDGLVMLEADGSVTLACSLTPNGDGTLSGPVMEPAALATGPQLALGQDVRLLGRDGSWPTSAQMLLIGRVVSIDPAPGQPLRRWVTVEPLVELRTISQAVLRIPLDGVSQEREP